MPLKSNFKQFYKETQEQIKDKLDKQQSEGKKIVLEAYRGIVKRSPVYTGLFRASNLISFNGFDYTVPDRVEPQNLTLGISQISGANFSRVNKIVIQNNLKYAEKLESGLSLQAPSGIYGITEAIIRGKLNKKI